MPAAIDPMIAMQGMNLGEMGYNATRVSEQLDISRAAARDILSLHGRWGKVAESPVFQQMRLEQKKHLEATSRMLSAKCLIQVDKQIHKASAYQAAGIYGLLRTHERLDAGEATQNISVHTTVEIGGLDELAEALSRKLISSSTQQNDTNSQSIQASADLRNEGHSKD